jgi:hypothetical protein
VKANKIFSGVGRVWPKGLAAALVTAGLAAGGTALADFKLTAWDASRSDGRLRTEALYEARRLPPGEFRDFAMIPASLAGEMGLAETPEGDGLRVERSEPPAGWDRESFLLAAPGVENVRVEDWRVSAEVISFQDGSPAAGASAGDAVSVRPVRAGALAALQVEVDPSRVLDAQGVARKAGSMRFLIEGPANAVEAPRLSENAVNLPEGMRGLFLNGHKLPNWRARRSPGRGGSVFPEPPGEVRVEYKAGDQIIRVPLASLGLADAAELAQAALTHHGALLASGGVSGTDAWFYAPRRTTLYDIVDAVFVDRAATTPSPAMATRAALSSLTPQGVEIVIPRQRLYEENLRYEWTNSRIAGEGFNFYRVRNPASGGEGPSKSIELAFFDRVPDLTLQVRLDLYGLNNFPSTSPDHKADISINGVALPQIGWDGIAMTSVTQTIALPSQPTSSLTLSHIVPTPTFAGDLHGLDIVELTWTGKPRVDDLGRGDIALDADAGGQPRLVTLAGFVAGTTAADVVLLDITDPNNPIRVLNPSIFTDETGTVGIEFEAPATACRFRAERFAQSSAPDAVAASVEMPDFPPASEPLIGVFVRPPSLAAALAPLVAMRAPNFMELDPQAAYDCYNGGQQSPFAIQDALKDIMAEAPLREAVPYIMLAGFGSLDPRDYLGFQTGAQIPPFLEKSVVISTGAVENSIDFPFSLLEGNDSIPDAAIARLPARTAALVTLAINRSMAHESLLDTLYAAPRTGVIVLDNDSEFQSDGPMWVSLWEQSGRPSSFYSLATTSAAAVISAIDQEFEKPASLGAAMAIYIGHGNNDTWAGEHLVTNSTIPGYVTQSIWPLVSTYTCLNHFYAFPDPTNPSVPDVSLGEAWMFEPNNGAVCSIAPVSVDFYFSQRLFAMSALEQIAKPEDERPRTVGQLMAFTQMQFGVEFPGLILTNKEYILFGDPASPLTLTARGIPVELSAFSLE